MRSWILVEEDKLQVRAVSTGIAPLSFLSIVLAVTIRISPD